MAIAYVAVSSLVVLFALAMKGKDKLTRDDLVASGGTGLGILPLAALAAFRK